MEKKRLFRIFAKANACDIAKLAKEIKERYEIVIIKAPQKTLTMIKMREPVKSSLFYLGEVIVTEAIVELSGARGMAVTMGDNFGKTLIWLSSTLHATAAHSPRKTRCLRWRRSKPCESRRKTRCT
jgi:phosphonate C-P lyase system protein PhnG